MQHVNSIPALRSLSEPGPVNSELQTFGAGLAPNAVARQRVNSMAQLRLLAGPAKSAVRSLLSVPGSHLQVRQPIRRRAFSTW